MQDYIYVCVGLLLRERFQEIIFTTSFHIANLTHELYNSSATNKPCSTDHSRPFSIQLHPELNPAE